MDGELSYLEATNEKHKYAQDHMVRVSQEEYVRGNDGSVANSQLLCDFQKLEQEEATLRIELDRMKCNNDQLHKDDIGFRSEVDALEKHMSSLNG